MNTELPMSQRRKSNPSPSVILPDDLIVEILCLLNVKLLMKMKCVSKSWKTLISDPKFVKLHLNHSSRTSHSYVVSSKDSNQNDDHSFIPFNVNDLLENRSITFPDDPYYRLIDKDCRRVIGSCNGLVCLLCYSLSKYARKHFGYSLSESGPKEMCFRFWNPATRTISDKLGYFPKDMNKLKIWKFVFGYDNSTDTYKVVAIHSRNNLTKIQVFSFGNNVWSNITEVRVFSFSNDVWRNVHNFDGRPLQVVYYGTKYYGAVHLNCTVNWLAIDIASRFVIISLDLRTETHTKLLVPPGSEEMSHVIPSVCVLMDSLCYHHDIKGTDFVIWRMTKFGDEKSWTQFLKFSYQNLNLKRYRDFTLYENGDTLVFTAQGLQDPVIFYDWRNSTVVKTIVDKKIRWFSINNYVESLIPTC